MSEMKFYRYEYRSHDEGFGLPRVNIILQEFDKLRETPKGYWIVYSKFKNYSDEFKEKQKKWIPRKSKKRYAYPTKEEALTNLKARTKIRVQILAYQKSVCEQVLKQIENGIDL